MAQDQKVKTWAEAPIVLANIPVDLKTCSFQVRFQGVSLEAWRQGGHRTRRPLPDVQRMQDRSLQPLPGHEGQLVLSSR